MEKGVGLVRVALSTSDEGLFLLIIIQTKTHACMSVPCTHLVLHSDSLISHLDDILGAPPYDPQDGFFISEGGCRVDTQTVVIWGRLCILGFTVAPARVG